MKLDYRPADRAGRTRLMALCWIGVIMVFFSFSTTQEYYSMPIYPAAALLIGGAMAAGFGWLRWGTRLVAASAALAGAAVTLALVLVWNRPAPDDISVALTSHPSAYTLSLGHMRDLTLNAFAYLKLPLGIAAGAFLLGALAAWRLRRDRAFFAVALMMVVFFQAARLALVAFDPYMSSRPLAEALNRAPRGQLVIDDQYYTFSSIFFYADREALILNGRLNNLEYGSLAPGAPHVFISDPDFVHLWQAPGRCYLAIENRNVPKLLRLVGAGSLYRVAEAGGKSLFSNRPLQGSGDGDADRG